MVDGNVSELVNLTAGPSDFERVDFGAPAQTKMNARVAGGHVAHTALGLLDVSDAFGGEPERGTDPVAIGFCADEQDFEPVIGVAAIVAKNSRKVAAIVESDVDVAVVVEIGGGQTASDKWDD